jgi:hypothetical protein
MYVVIHPLKTIWGTTGSTIKLFKRKTCHGPELSEPVSDLMSQDCVNASGRRVIFQTMIWSYPSPWDYGPFPLSEGDISYKPHGFPVVE